MFIQMNKIHFIFKHTYKDNLKNIQKSILMDRSNIENTKTAQPVYLIRLKNYSFLKNPNRHLLYIYIDIIIIMFTEDCKTHALGQLHLHLIDNVVAVVVVVVVVVAAAAPEAVVVQHRLPGMAGTQASYILNS